VLTLATHTGWALNELLELDGEELSEWMQSLRAVVGRK